MRLNPSAAGDHSTTTSGRATALAAAPRPTTARITPRPSMSTLTWMIRVRPSSPTVSTKAVGPCSAATEAKSCGSTAKLTAETLLATQLDWQAPNEIQEGEQCNSFTCIILPVHVHPAAHKHGIEREAIEHALRHPITIIEVDPEQDPRRVLTIGPDPTGLLLEIVSLSLDEDDVVIHAMKLRPTYRSHLPRR
ncbi:MAG: hypothetical protein F4017_05320 [Acidimicrobiaceae bacterium]|nr:hypothetical protein [Acidimicrobiaceae bacterium]MYK74000.1 hypothetical protein [Acidimicrobiaceae bacterium]